MVNELLGAAWGNDGVHGLYELAGCDDVDIHVSAEGVQWWFVEERDRTALTPPRSWAGVTGAGRSFGTEALRHLAAATDLEREPGRAGSHFVPPGAARRVASPNGGAEGGWPEPVDVDASAGPSIRNAARTNPLTLDFTRHGYDEGATRAYNCIPEPSQQHHMRTFVSAVGSPCDGGSIAEFPAGRIVFQIRCRDSAGQSAAWSLTGSGPASFAKPVETTRVWIRSPFSGTSMRLSVRWTAPYERLVVNELLGASWNNDGINALYDLGGCREVNVDTGSHEDVEWRFLEEPALTALWPRRAWSPEPGGVLSRVLSSAAREDLDAVMALEHLWRGSQQ